MLHKNILTVILASALALAVPAFAQRAPGPLVLKVHPLHDGVYWISGGVSNTGFIVGDKGVVVIDTQETPDDAKAALAEIAKVTSKPVNDVIVSHGDPDHLCGLPAFPANATFIAQENVRSVIAASVADIAHAGQFASCYKELEDHRLPAWNIAGSQGLVLDGVRMELMHIAPAHTNGDLFVYLPKQKIVFAGDIITTNTGPYPIIHIDGSTLGWIQSMQAMLALDADTYIPGHGQIETKAMLREWLHRVERRRQQIKVLVYQGKTLAQINQALPEKGAIPFFRNFNQTVYEELTRGYPATHAPWINFINQRK